MSANAFKSIRKTDALSLGGFENDPSVGKYVNQDGLQQLRHYLKVGPYRTALQGSANNPFFGYLRQVMQKTKRNIEMENLIVNNSTMALVNIKAPAQSYTFTRIHNNPNIHADAVVDIAVGIVHDSEDQFISAASNDHVKTVALPPTPTEPSTPRVKSKISPPHPISPTPTTKTTPSLSGHKQNSS